MKTFFIKADFPPSLQSVKKFAQNKISIAELETALLSVDPMDFYILYNGLSILQVVIESGIVAIDRLNILIDTLLRVTLRDRFAFVFLLSYSTQNTAAPFYFALQCESDSLLAAQKILEWAYFGVRWRFAPGTIFQDMLFPGVASMIADAGLGNVESFVKHLTTMEKAIFLGGVSKRKYQDILMRNRISSNKKQELVHYRLLSICLSRPHSITARALLLHVEKLFLSGWLDRESFIVFLFDHPRYEEGFSYLHELIRSSDCRNVYTYVRICLNLILTRDLDPNILITQLLQLNRMQHSILFQAVNNHALETAELFLNIFHILLPGKLDNELQMTGKLRVHARKDKVYHQEINSLVSQVISQPDSTVLFYRENGRVPSDFFLDLIQSLYQVARRMKPRAQVEKSRYSLFANAKPQDASKASACHDYSVGIC